MHETKVYRQNNDSEKGVYFLTITKKIALQFSMIG